MVKAKKEKITLAIDGWILKQYRTMAEKECLNISKKVERFFSEELSNKKEITK